MHRRNFTILGCGHQAANGVYVFEGFRNMFPFFVKRELQFDDEPHDEPINFGNDKLDMEEFTRLDRRMDVFSRTSECKNSLTPKPKNARIVDDQSGIIFALYGGVISAHGELMWVIARVDCNPPIYYYAAFHESLYPDISVYSCAVPTETWTVLNGAEPAPRLKLTIYATELLDKGSEVEVFSTSQQKWKRAVISQVDGDEFHIECEADGWRSRVRRGSGRLRPTVEQRKERAKWKEQTPVEVFSVSNSKWKPAKIIEIKELRVEYADGSGGKWMGADSDWIKAVNQAEHESDLLNYEGGLATHMQSVVRNIFSTYASGRSMTRREFCQFLRAAWPNKRKSWYIQMTNDEFDRHESILCARELQAEHEQGIVGPRRRRFRRHSEHRPRGQGGDADLARAVRRNHRRHHHHRDRHRRHGHRSISQHTANRHGRDGNGMPVLRHHHHASLPVTHRAVARGLAGQPPPAPMVPLSGLNGTLMSRIVLPPVPLYNDGGVVRFNPSFDFNDLNLLRQGDLREGQVIPLADIRLNDVDVEEDDCDFVMVEVEKEEDEDDELAELEKSDLYEYGFSAFAEYFLNSCSDRPKATRSLLVNLAHREFERPAPPPQAWKVSMKVNAYSKTQKEWKRATIVQMNKQGGKLHVQYGDETGRKWLARYSDHIRPRIETRARIALWATNRFLEVLEGLQTSHLGRLLNAEVARFLVEFNFDECNQCHYFDDIYAVCFGNNCDGFMCRTCWNDGFNFHNCEAMTQGHRRAAESMSPETPFLFVSTFDQCPEINKKRKLMARIRVEEAQAKYTMHQIQQRHQLHHQTGPLYEIGPFDGEEDTDFLDLNETQDLVHQVVSQQEMDWLNQHYLQDSDLENVVSRRRDGFGDDGRPATSPSPSFAEDSLSFSRGFGRIDVMDIDAGPTPPPPPLPVVTPSPADRRITGFASLPRNRTPLDLRSPTPLFEFGRDGETVYSTPRRYFGSPFSMNVDEDDSKLDDAIGPRFVREILQERERPARSQRLFGEETLLQRVGAADVTGASQSSNSSTPDPNEDGASPILDDDGDFEVHDSVDAAPQSDDEPFSFDVRQRDQSAFSASSPFAR